MANVFSPNGFTAVRRQDGAGWTANQKARLIAHANTNKFYSGDPVVQLSTGYIDCLGQGSAPAQGPVGIFVGCSYISTAQSRTVWSKTWQGADSANDVTAYIIDDPNVVWQVWVGTGSSSAAGGPAVLADIGKSCYWQLGTGSATTGISGAYIDYASMSTSSVTQAFTVYNLIQSPPGTNGTDITTAGNLIEVIFNQTAFRQGQTPV